MNIIIISDSFIIREALLNILSIKFKEYSIQSEASLTKLQKEDLSRIDCMIVDIDEKNIKLIIDTKKDNEKLIIIALDFKQNQEIFTALIKSGIEGYIVDMSDKEEFIYKISMVLKGKKHYDAEMIGEILNNEFKIEVKELTKRELEVLCCVAKGLSNKEISKQLYISECTVKKHITSILYKLDLRNRKDLIIYANENNLNKYTCNIDIKP